MPSYLSFGAPCERLSAPAHSSHLAAYPGAQPPPSAPGRSRGPVVQHWIGWQPGTRPGLFEALDLAEQHSPRITAQRLQIDAASSSQKSAGTLPDPKLSVGIENFPVSGMDRFSLTRESMTMQRLALMQEVPNRAKRDAQIAGAEAKGGTRTRRPGRPAPCRSARS